MPVPENDLREYNYLLATTGANTDDVVRVALALRKKNNNNHLVLLIRDRRQLRHLLLLK